MGKLGKKRRKKTIGYNHLGMFGISLIVLILILTLVAQSRDLKESLAGYRDQGRGVSASQVEEEQARTQEIEESRSSICSRMSTQSRPPERNWGL